MGWAALHESGQFDPLIWHPLAHAQSSIDMCKDGREIEVAINDQIEYYF